MQETMERYSTLTEKHPLDIFVITPENNEIGLLLSTFQEGNLQKIFFLHFTDTAVLFAAVSFDHL